MEVRKNNTIIQISINGFRSIGVLINEIESLSLFLDDCEMAQNDKGVGKFCIKVEYRRLFNSIQSAKLIKSKDSVRKIHDILLFIDIIYKKNENHLDLLNHLNEYIGYWDALIPLPERLLKLKNEFY